MYPPRGASEDAEEIFRRIHPDDLVRVQASIAESAANLSPWNFEFRVQHPEKGELWVEGRSMPRLRPDGGILWYGFLHDITEHKNLELDLFKARKMEIIGQLAGGVAHEVRNPLNAILSISEALFREKEIAGNPEFLPYIEHIRTQIGRLSKLMSDLLDLGKPIRPANICPVSLDDICTELTDSWKVSELSGIHHLECIFDSVPRQSRIDADAARLSQVLFNLLENAAQYSPEGSSIQLRVMKTSQKRIALQVQDVGKGIPPKEIDRVFEPFFTTRRGGTGLGLSLVKHFIENMGGEVRIMNNILLLGCTVELILGTAGEEKTG